MSREILFRAKVLHPDPMTAPESGWVEGFYYQDLVGGEVRHFIKNCPCDWEIDPGTLGQATDVLDVNGNMIFEGDIVETFAIRLAYRQVGNYPPPNVEVEEYDIEHSVNTVVFNSGSFDINGFPICFEDVFYDPKEIDDSRERREFEAMWEDNSYEIRDKYPHLTWAYFHKPHILGNIHDNGDLLE